MKVELDDITRRLVAHILMENSTPLPDGACTKQLIRVTMDQNEIVVDVMTDDDEPVSRGRIVLECHADQFRFEIHDEKGEFRNTDGSDGNVAPLDWGLKVPPTLTIPKADGWYVVIKDDGGAGPLTILNEVGSGPFDQYDEAVRAAERYAAPMFVLRAKNGEEMHREQV